MPAQPYPGRYITVWEDRLAAALSALAVRFTRQAPFRNRDGFVRTADFQLTDSGIYVEVDPPPLSGTGGAIDRVARDLVYMEHGWPVVRIDNRMLNSMVDYWARRLAEVDARWSNHWTPYRRQRIQAERAARSNVLPYARQLDLDLLWFEEEDNRAA